MGLREKIGEKITDWLTKSPAIEKIGEQIEGSFSDWLATQPGTDGLHMKLSCSTCGNTWDQALDLKKMKLSEAIRTCMKCPICGSQKLKVLRG